MYAQNVILGKDFGLELGATTLMSNVRVVGQALSFLRFSPSAKRVKRLNI